MAAFAKFMRLHAVLSVAVLVGIGIVVVMGLLDGLARQEPAPRITTSIGLELVRIPAGSFVMGSPKNEEGRQDDEERHDVQITRAFYLGVFEVTQAEYRKIMGVNPSHFSAKGEGRDRVKEQKTDKFPVEQVSWTQAKEFCKKLSALADEKKAGRVYRLPSEAEWEYACRGGTKTPVHYGASLNIHANFCGLAPYPLRGKRGFDEGNTRDVGSYDPNTFGLFDMHGNVHEWCEDWYAPYRKEKQVDPRGPDTGTERVFRGGCWLSTGRACRSAQRAKLPPDETHFGVGFRVVMELK